MKRLFKVFLVFILFLTFNSNVINADAITLPKVGTLLGANMIQSSNFSHDDKYIVTAHNNGEVAIWDATNTNIITKWKASEVNVSKALYNNDSSKIISSDDSGIIKIWDVTSGRLISTIDSTNGASWKRYVRDIVLNKDSSILYSANYNDKSVRIWDVNSGKMLKEITFTSTPMYLDYNPIDNHIAIVTEDGSLNIRNGSDGSYVLTIPNKDLKGNVKYSSDYKTLFASCRSQKQPILLNVENGYKQISLNKEDYRIKNGDNYSDIYWNNFDITYDDKYIIVSGDYSSINYIFDNNTKKLVVKCNGRGPVKFNHNGNRVLYENILLDTSQLPDRQLSGIEINAKDSIMKIDEMQDIIVNELFSDGTKKQLELKDVEFKSDNPQVANILYGKLNSYKEGTATITASYRGFTSQIVIKVQNFKILEKQLNVPVDKVWDVKFNMNVDKNTIKEKNIYITDAAGNILPMFYYSEKGQETNIKLMPVKSYKSGETYTIWIKELESTSGVKLKQYTKMEFQIN